MKLRFYLLIIPLLSNTAMAMGLEQFLEGVFQHNRAVQSYQRSMEASGYRREAGDTELSPLLVWQESYLDNQQPQASVPVFLITRTQGLTHSMTLSELFPSGTQASVNATLQQLALSATNFLASPTGSSFNESIGIGSVGVNLSQSLWKNFFGRSTRLREDRQRKIEALEKGGFDLQIRQLMVDAEGAYWDYLYLQDELKQRQDSLERAHKIENWVKTRFGNGIGDRADVLNAQGLTAARELQLLQTQDDFVAIKKKITDLLEISEPTQIPSLEGQLGAPRKIDNLVSGQGTKKVRLDSYLAVLEAKAKAVGADEASEAMKPDLVLSGSYSTNSFDPTNGATGAYNQIYNTNIPTINVALKLSWLLDGDLKNANREMARRDALASTLLMQRKLLESDSAWQEMNRRHGELSKKVAAAKLVSEVQGKKASVERERLAKGRTITSDVISAEQDAAESGLTLSKLQAEHRKLESQARLFLNVEEIQ